MICFFQIANPQVLLAHHSPTKLLAFFRLREPLLHTSALTTMCVFCLTAHINNISHSSFRSIYKTHFLEGVYRPTNIFSGRVTTFRGEYLTVWLDFEPWFDYHFWLLGMCVYGCLYKCTNTAVERMGLDLVLVVHEHRGPEVRGHQVCCPKLAD